MIHFLAGLPRSGSTVLAAILNQHPQIKVTGTSPLIDVMGGVAMAWESSPSVKATAEQEDLYKILRSVSGTYHGGSKPIVLDKSRGWPSPAIVRTMTNVLGQPPKIIATVRNVPDCVASFVRLVRPEDVKTFLRTSQLVDHIRNSYVTLREGYSQYPTCFHFVDYDKLLSEPRKELDGILSFLEAYPHDFDLSCIDGTPVAEKDEEAWGIKNLHEVKPVLKKQHTEDSHLLLGSLYSTFEQPRFWDKTPSVRTPTLIDLQLEANVRGDFVRGREIATILEKTSPDDDRAAFNRGWHLIREGRLVDGISLLDRGRPEQVFGNKNPSGAPLWNGKSGSNVLLNLEGGLGDQIHGVRFAKDIAARGNRVIVAASKELVPTFNNCEGVSAAVTHAVAPEVYHDSWVPSMSAPAILGMEWNKVKGAPYIKAPFKVPRNKLHVGLRWQGNPRFEEEQHRLFPVELLFQAVREFPFDFISLQRDQGSELRPDWVEKVPLDTWEDTRNVVGNLDLVVTSCTSVAHMAGAMGIPTWIVIPVMPYYLWALPKDTTPWYDSVRLFRQTKYGEWSDVFDRIKTELGKLK